ncbi:TrmH family RNA methyltransferase [Ekhidna sp.]|uniref:TrmH family RNA methyltransferase n=1 Tax=Ekhidna sp. TaxID=2608089 RepID=UPI003CCB9E99
MDHQQAIDILEEFVSENKQTHVERVLEKRTRHIRLVFEDIDKPHNVSAVLRTAECMGIQDLHFIKNKNSYSVNPGITQGATKWVTLHHHTKATNNVDACYDHLRSSGYQIYATSLHETSRSIEDIDPSKKTAIVFGTEADGISEEAGEKADGFVHIPMQGFTESFNLSVSAAICLTVLKAKLKEWPPLDEHEKLVLRSEWYRKIVREADLILKTKGVEI